MSGKVDDVLENMEVGVMFLISNLPIHPFLRALFMILEPEHLVLLEAL